MLYVGGGVVLADACEELRAFVDHLGIPVAHSLMGKGALPDDHPLLLGMSGFWGTKLVNDTCLAADWVLGLGTRFKEADCSSWYRDYTFNIPPTQAHPHRHRALRDRHGTSPPRSARWRISSWRSASCCRWRAKCSPAARAAGDGSRIAKARREFAARNQAMATSDAFPMMPERILAEVRAQLPRDAIITTDVGWNKNGVGQQFPVYTPGSVLTPGGFATMGFGPPAAIGAKFAAPDRVVVSLVGDGGFGQNPAALATAVEHGLAIVWLVMNNNAFGTIAGLQKAAYGLTHGTLFPSATVGWDAQKPDYAEIARGYGCEAERLRSAADLAPALRRALVVQQAVPARRAHEEQPDADHRALEHSRHLRAREAPRARRDGLNLMSREILVSEVGPRDGLQSIKSIMPLEAKKAWISALAPRECARSK